MEATMEKVDTCRTSRYTDSQYRCGEHGTRFYFFLNHSRWLCQIRKWNSSQGVWDLVDVIIDVNDNADGVVNERIERVC